MSSYSIDDRSELHLVSALLLAGLWLGVTGCDGRDRLSTAPVEGRVLYRNKPLKFGSVMFQPEAGPSATGVIRPDGSFKLSTYGSGDGAVVGKHRVRISCSESQSPNAPTPDPNSEPKRGKLLIPRKYSHVKTSGLTAEVKEDNGPFEFKLID